MSPVSAEFLNDGKMIKYYVGLFNRFHDADAALIKVKAAGFKEAFILAYFNKKKIPLERAKELEKMR
jgi:N-acetylmuramoyl-L-alanine amidase